MSASDLDRRLGIVACRHCGAIYDLTRKDQRPLLDEAAAEAPAPVDRAPAALPSRFTVDMSHGDRLRIRWRWFRPMALFLIFFCIAWDGFLVTWYGIGLAMDDAPIIMFLFPLIHVAVGVALTYYTLALLLNTTTVAVTRGELTVRHGPLPWVPATLPVRDLEQLYVERKVRHNKNGTSVTFQLMAVTRDHSGRKLVGGLEELGQALYLEQEIERTLGIRDRPVAGEHRGDGTQM